MYNYLYLTIEVGVYSIHNKQPTGK